MAFTKQCYVICLASLFVLGIWASQVLCRPNPEQSMLERHEQWMAHHGRVYKDAEEKEKRFKIFKDNVERIEAFNEDTNRGFKLGVNKFADLTNEEFRAFYTGYKRPSVSQPISESKEQSFMYADVTDVPSSMDWREKGAVTDIKDQGHCGCCWAFSTIAAVEGLTQIKTGNLISLSEQELVDCTSTNWGCQGGYMENAFEFIRQNQGVMTEENYSYKGIQGTCNSNTAASNEGMISGYQSVPANSEEALLSAVANQPVSITIDGGNFAFQHYSSDSGIFREGCGTEQDHAVTAVGYSVADDGTKYWLLKNSWGTGWGEGGYMRLQRDVAAPEGLCGVAMRASYPIA